MDLSTADRMMIQVPMFHCFGMVLSMTSCMTHGATLCPMPYFSAKVSLACINQERITCFNGVPTMFIAMFNHPDYKKTDFSYMRTGIMAGSGCPPELMRRAAQPDEMNMRGIVSVYARTILASLFAGAIAAIALWLLGGYQLDGFAWSSKITAIITLVICGSVMGLAYLAGVQIFRVKEANALLAPITSKLERLARR